MLLFLYFFYSKLSETKAETKLMKINATLINAKYAVSSISHCLNSVQVVRYIAQLDVFGILQFSFQQVNFLNRVTPYSVKHI